MQLIQPSSQIGYFASWFGFINDLIIALELVRLCAGAT